MQGCDLDVGVSDGNSRALLSDPELQIPSGGSGERDPKNTPWIDSLIGKEPSEAFLNRRRLSCSGPSDQTDSCTHVMCCRLLVRARGVDVLLGERHDVRERLTEVQSSTNRCQPHSSVGPRPTPRC